MSRTSDRGRGGSVPKPVWDDGPADCWQCHTGHLIGYADRDQVPTLAQRLTELRARRR